MPNAYGYLNPMQMQMQGQKMEVIKVNGRNGVEMFRMPPNASVLLLDENEPIVWLAQTDGAGYKTATPYRISPIEEKKPEDLSNLIATLESRIENLERMVTENESNVKSANAGFSNAKQNEPVKRNGKQN